MDKIEKFLKILSKKERKYLLEVILPCILNLNLSDFDVKKVKSMPFWRVKYKTVRIIFAKKNEKGVIMRIGFRKDAYKNLSQLAKQLKG